MAKKMVALFMAAAMMTGALTGCGNSTAENRDSSSTVAQTSDEASGEKTQVEFWYAGGKTAVGVVQDIIDEYNASQDQYEVTAVTQAVYTETYQKLQAGIAGNAAPDVVLLQTATARVLSDKNLLTDLGSFIDQDDEFQESDYLEVFMEQGKDDEGKIFAIPAYGTTQILYYNIEAFHQAGIDPESITTWQDLAAAAKTIKEKTDATYGWEPMWGAVNLIDAAMSNGASVLSEDGKTVMINSDEWVEVFEAFRTWIHDDEIMAIHSGGQGWEYWYATMDDALNGIAGGYTGSSGDQADLDFSVVAAKEQPAWDADTTSAPLAEGLTLSVLESSSDAEKEGAYDFIKYFTNADSQAKWSMSTGYVPVNKNVADNAEYAAYLEENPHAAVPFAQASHGSVYPYDPTNGEIMDAISIAVDKVEIDGVSAQEALDEAQKTAQKALDEALEGK